MKSIASAFIAATYMFCPTQPSSAHTAAPSPDAVGLSTGAAPRPDSPPQIESSGGSGGQSRELALISVRSFGAKCDGTTDDAPSINAALRFASTSGGGVVAIPPGATCDYRNTIVVPNRVTLRGEGWSSALKADTANLAVGIQMGSGASAANLEDLTVDAGEAGANSSGTTVDMGVATGSRVRNVFILNPCVGISVSGNTPIVEGVQVKGVRHAGCRPIQVGEHSIGAQTVDARIMNSTLNCDAAAPGDADLAIYDSGGLFMQNDDFLFCVNGLLIKPGPKQQVIWTFASNTALSDSTAGSGVVFDTGDSSAVIKGFVCVGCWSASGRGHGVWIRNSSGGMVDGVHFVALRDYNHSLDGFHIDAGANITVDDSHICGFGQERSATGFFVGPTISDGALRGSTVKDVCDGNPQPPKGNSAVGVRFSGSNKNWTVVGDVVSGETNPFYGTPSGASFVQAGAQLGVGMAPENGDTLDLYSAATQGSTANLIGDRASSTYQSSAYSSSGQFQCRRAGGSFEMPSPVSSRDVVCRVEASAWDGLAFQAIGGLDFSVDAYGGSDNLSGRVCVSTRPDGSGAALTQVMCLTKAQHEEFVGGGPPTLSRCGPDPVLARGSTDTVGEFSIGAAASSCTLIFRAAYGGEPTCVVADESAVKRLREYSTTAKALTVTLSEGASDKIHYQCNALGTY